MKKRVKKIKDQQLVDFNLVPNSVGIILDSIWIKNDNSELIIKSAFGGQWHLKPLIDNEEIL